MDYTTISWLLITLKTTQLLCLNESVTLRNMKTFKLADKNLAYKNLQRQIKIVGET